MNLPSQTYLPVPRSRLVIRVTLVVIVLLLCTTGFSILDLQRTQREMGPILSAFFSDHVLRDVKGPGAGGEIQIVVVRESRNLWDRELLPRRLVFDPESSFSQSLRTTRLSLYLSNVFSTDIQARLNLPSGAQSLFITRSELLGNKPTEFQTRFPNNVGYFVVSHPGLNLRKTEAILYVDHFCGGLCGGGGYFLMRKVNGVWHVVDQHVTWAS